MSHILSQYRGSNRMPYQQLTSDGIEANMEYPVKKQIQSVINGPNNDERFTATGYKTSIFLTLFFHISAILSLGVLYLIVYWRPDWGTYIKQRRSPLQDANSIILKDIDGITHSVSVETSDINSIQEIFASHNSNHLKSYFSPVTKSIRFFTCRHIKYLWNLNKNEFECIIGLGNSIAIESLLNDYQGFTESQSVLRQEIYGRNEIVIELPSYLKLLFSEVLNPFNVFQIFSIILWSFDDYYLYAMCIFLISCLSIAMTLYETRKQSESLKNMVELSNANSVTILRSYEHGKKEVNIDSQEVVPGDVMVIPADGCVMACDAVIISGNAIVNESMLTGESVPVTKTPITSADDKGTYSGESSKKNTLFCGTTVIRTRYYGKAQVLAVVVKTGFNTAKGELVRSILYPRPIDFKFYKDAMKFILVLFSIAMIGMSYSIYLYVSRNKPIIQTIVRTLDIVTIVVPPALPAAMTVGAYYAQSRLKKLGIFCISPPRINISGKLKLICFDKTGTLTEDGLEVWGAMGVDANRDGKINLGVPVFDLIKEKSNSLLIHSLATCHSLTYVNGKIIGDPLDVKMFEATGWTLIDPEENECFDSLVPPVVKSPGDDARKNSAPEQAFHEDYSYTNPCILNEDTTEYNTQNHNASGADIQIPCQIGLIRQFPFSSALQRMTVVVRVLGSQNMELFVKGAPEKIQSLCMPETIPENFNAVLNKFTLEGFRVIALAHKHLDRKMTWLYAQKVQRTEIEHGLKFVGFLLLQNALKPQTAPVIEELKNSNTRCVMVTGDNILTAICVARDCGMVNASEDVYLVNITSQNDRKLLSLELISSQGSALISNTPQNCISLPLERHAYHLAITGDTWAQLKQYFPQYVSYAVLKGTIFGRMSPDQKIQLVEELQKMDYIVGMCGDGANDCGALKTAHVGISLSEAEASVAAPFTSRIANISCVPKVMCEGRCALATNFSIFKYMALYSMIQFVSILILYTVCSNLSDQQFLYIDLFIVTSVAVFMGYTESKHKLVKQRPISNLFGPINLFSVISQMILVIFGQLIAYLYLYLQPWYTGDFSICQGNQSDIRVLTWETTVIFTISAFQYLSLAIIYSPGHPFRKPLYTNIWLISTIVLFSGISAWFIIYPWPWVSAFMKLHPYPDDPLWLFRGTLLCIVFVHFASGWLVENYIASSRLLKKTFQVIFCKREAKNMFKRVCREMNNNPLWPPIETAITTFS